MFRKSKIFLAVGVIALSVFSAGVVQASSAFFKDVPASNGYAEAINWAKNQGVMSGTSSSTFSPDSPVTRAQLAQVLYNLNKQGMISSNNSSNTTSAPSKADVSTLQGYQASLFTQGSASQTKPDDITILNSHIFLAYQNGVGSKGEATQSGIKESTIVEYDQNGNKLNSWNVIGKVDGMGADPNHNRVLATVNEDGNSSMYSIQPDAAQGKQIQHITFATPLAHGGGTDAVAVQNGNIYVSASAPTADSNGNFTKPALYQATIDGESAALKPVMMDNATASDVTSGKPVTLNLSDPDSNAIVPSASSQYSGDIMLDSQGDSKLVFIQNPGTSSQKQTSLSLGTQVDDVAWSTSSNGTLYVVDGGDNKTYAITGNFKPGTVFVACPSDSGVAGFVGTLDLGTGMIHPFAIGLKSPKGLLFIPKS